MSEEDKLIEQIAQTYRDVVGPVPLAQRLPELLQELQPGEQIIPKPKDQPITIRLEWKPQDCWIGVYTRKTDLFPWRYRRRWQRDIWICILPMLPIHLWWTRTEKP